MIAAGSRSSIAATGMVWGTISEYTRASRTRRAMSWAYWAPKSTTRTRSWSVVTGHPTQRGPRPRRSGPTPAPEPVTLADHEQDPGEGRAERPERLVAERVGVGGVELGAVPDERPPLRQLPEHREHGPDAGDRHPEQPRGAHLGAPQQQAGAEP